MVAATLAMAVATFLVALASGFTGYLIFRQIEFQLRPDFEARLEWDEIAKDLFIVFQNWGSIPLKADIYIYISRRVPESDWSKFPEARFLKSRKSLPKTVREKTKLPTLDHLIDELYGRGQISRWPVRGAIDAFIQMQKINMQDHPFLQVRFEGQFWATVTRWPFRTKWPYRRLQKIYWVESEQRWQVSEDEFID